MEMHNTLICCRVFMIIYFKLVVSSHFRITQSSILLKPYTEICYDMGIFHDLFANNTSELPACFEYVIFNTCVI